MTAAGGRPDAPILRSGNMARLDTSTFPPPPLVSRRESMRSFHVPSLGSAAGAPAAPATAALAPFLMVECNSLRVASPATSTCAAASPSPIASMSSSVRSPTVMATLAAGAATGAAAAVSVSTHVPLPPSSSASLQCVWGWWWGGWVWGAAHTSISGGIHPSITTTYPVDREEGALAAGAAAAVAPAAPTRAPRVFPPLLLKNASSALVRFSAILPTLL